MRRMLLLFAIVAGMPILAGGTAQAQDATPAALELNYPELRMVATDYAFEITGQVAAGLTLVTMDNDGAEPHHTQLMLLSKGRTMAELETALGQGPEAIVGLGQFVGGPAVAEPGGQSQVILDLAPGNYVALCFVDSPDGIPHLAKGMVQAFEVAEAGTPTAAAPPSSVGTVVMRDFSFELPTIAAGPQIWEVVNEGPQPHEIQVLKLEPGVTAEQVMGMLMGPPPSPAAEHEMASPMAGGPPPFTAAGGMQALSTGLRGWAVLDLEPGDYVALCFVPDPGSGQPHVALGMVATFTVE